MMHTGLLMAELANSANRAIAASLLTRCEWWCPRLGVVSELRTHRTFCRFHFGWFERLPE
jgi:hypothetical protein